MVSRRAATPRITFFDNQTIIVTKIVLNRQLNMQTNRHQTSYKSKPKLATVIIHPLKCSLSSREPLLTKARQQ